MFNVFLLILNFAFSLTAGVVFAVVTGWDLWLISFFVGFVLWNVVVSAILLVVGFVLSESYGREGE